MPAEVAKSRQTKIDHSTHHSRFLNLGRPSWPFAQCGRECQAAKRVGFPEIDAMPQPVLLIGAGDEAIAGQDLLRHGRIAAVKAEDESWA